MKAWLGATIIAGGLSGLLRAQETSTPYRSSVDFLSWSAQQARQIATGMREDGRVGSFFDFRVTHTERSYNYKLRATWLTPEVIRASARLEQLRSRLSEAETLRLVSEAESAGDTVIMVEIDPREGSGVIPLDWQSFLQPKALEGSRESALHGVNTPRLRDAKALGGLGERDYDYDVFWVVFGLTDDKGSVVLSDSTDEAELVVRIYGKEGRVTWPVAQSIRDRAAVLASERRLRPNGEETRPPN